MDPLDALHDITETADATWWPLAWGWWVLIAALIALATYLTVVAIRRRRHRAAARQALMMLKDQSFNSLADINAIAKRHALAYGSRKQIASLTGSAWLDFMVSTMPATDRQQFDTQVKSFESLIYQSASDEDIKAYQQLVVTWVEKANV